MKIGPYFALIATATYSCLFLRGIVWLVSSALVNANITIDALRKAILVLRGAAALLLALYALSFGENEWVTLLLIVALTWGAELKSHLGRRTTAAFSTSDVQQQRLFNLSIFLAAGASVVAYGLHRVGLNPFYPGIAELVLRTGIHARTAVLYGIGDLIFAYYVYTLSKHWGTLAYLIRSYWIMLKEGKLKRIW